MEYFRIAFAFALPFISVPAIMGAFWFADYAQNPVPVRIKWDKVERS